MNDLDILYHNERLLTALCILQECKNVLPFGGKSDTRNVENFPIVFTVVHDAGNIQNVSESVLSGAAALLSPAIHQRDDSALINLHKSSFVGSCNFDETPPLNELALNAAS